MQALSVVIWTLNGWTLALLDRAALPMERVFRLPNVEQTRSPWCLEVIGREDLAQVSCWRSAFANERKDHRYYELVEDTRHSEFDYRYFVIRDASGGVRAVQPFFLLDQDLLVGTSQRFGALVRGIPSISPRFMHTRTPLIRSLP